jgi:hypothetical protein
MKSVDITTDHPINGQYAGQSWYDFYTTHYDQAPIKIIPGSSGAEIIGNYVLRTDEAQITGVSSILTETSLGGRAAIFGYNLWTNLVNSAKRHQILRAADWVCRNRMPVYLETPSQVVVIPRVSPEGKVVSVMLVNASIDSSPPLLLRLRHCKGGSARWLVPERGDIMLSSNGNTAELCVEIGPIGPWELGVVEVT